MRFRVRYAETDQMKVVYHGSYLPWLEMARTELCRVNGFRYRDMELEDDLRLAVVEVRLRYHRAALYDDEIIAEAWVEQAHPRMVSFGYEIKNAETGEVLTTGETKHVMLDASGKPVRIPPKYFSLFGLAR